ncbi:MAG: sugar nucleotide-binding protein, partial [Bacteroidales bacterium]|nr:sugar nucleotide-binding protein [Bacteroidales bacterium]
MLRNILITGANGQLGQSLKTLTEKNSDYNFIFVDKEEADLTDNTAISRLFETNSLYAVLHFAAYTAVDKAESEK